MKPVLLTCVVLELARRERTFRDEHGVPFSAPDAFVARSCERVT